jgi:hypothetical protein
MGFKPGAHLSRLDALIIVSGLAFCLWPARIVPPEARQVVGFLMGMFFLFLSVFRVSRDLQYAWLLLFVAVAVATTVGGIPNWALTFKVASVLAVVVIVLQVRKPAYRGVFWRKLNPSLPDWLEEQREEDRR